MQSRGKSEISLSMMLNLLMMQTMPRECGEGGEESVAKDDGAIDSLTIE